MRLHVIDYTLYSRDPGGRGGENRRTGEEMIGEEERQRRENSDMHERRLAGQLLESVCSMRMHGSIGSIGVQLYSSVPSR